MNTHKKKKKEFHFEEIFRNVVVNPKQIKMYVSH